MEFRNEQPIYLQIAQKIKEQIVNGSLEPDEKLPSVRECSVLYEVSALAIQRTMQYLESEGVICSRKGVGNFVRRESLTLLRHQMVRLQVQEFVQAMKNCGCGPDEILALVREELSAETVGSAAASGIGDAAPKADLEKGAVSDGWKDGAASERASGEKERRQNDTEQQDTE